MSKHLSKLLCSAILACSALSSCQDYEPNAEIIIEKATVHNYDKAFHEAFPEISSNQNWGFDPMPVCGDDIEITRGMNTNSNEWAPKYHYEVPGGAIEGPWGHTPGDITNYERAYVYWWFSTHQWPQPIQVNWSEFFIENVWGQPEHSNVLGDPSSTTYAGLVNQLGMNNLKILLNGKTPSNSPYDNRINNTSTAMQHAVSEVSSDNYDHVNDFNASGAAAEQVMYAYDVSTKDIYYEESHGITDKLHNNWTIRYINGNYYLAFDYWSQKKNGNGFLSEPYTYYEPDGYYNDWILKISSGTHTVDRYTRRVMCEDLGNTYDWDFNDLVFDVTIFEGNYGDGNAGYYAQITLQAAGGTLPIYIGKKEEAYEAHFLFGLDYGKTEKTPVNVDAPNGVKRAAVVFHLPLYNEWGVVVNNNGTTTIDFNKIPIIVDRSSKSGSNNYAAEELDPMNPAASGDIVLESVIGEAPQKFACRSDTYWMKEQKSIWTGHKLFKEWVAGNKTEEETFVTSERVYGNSDVEPAIPGNSNLLVSTLYADNGKPYAGAHGDVNEEISIKEWKTLWNTKEQDENADVAAYTAVRSYPKIVKSDGSYDIYNKDNTTYNTTFQAQAPYIYETVGEDDDPTAYSVRTMPQIFNSDRVNEEVVWKPNAREVTVETESSNNGNVLGSGYYHNGANVEITAVPRAGWEFDYWENVNDASEKLYDNPYTISNISADKHYKAHYKQIEGYQGIKVYYTTDTPGGGYIQGYKTQSESSDGLIGMFEAYSGEHTFVAVPNEGYGFVCWNDDEDEWTTDIIVDIEDKDITIKASYEQLEKIGFVVESENTNYGSAQATRFIDGSIINESEYYEKTMLRLTATPATGYLFDKWEELYDNVHYTDYPLATFTYETPSHETAQNVKMIAHFKEASTAISKTQTATDAPPTESYSNYSKFLASITVDNGFPAGYNWYPLIEGLNSYSKCCLAVTFLDNNYISIRTGENQGVAVQSYNTLGTVTKYVEANNISALSIDDNNQAAKVSKIVIWVEEN